MALDPIIEFFLVACEELRQQMLVTTDQAGHVAGWSDHRTRAAIAFGQKGGAPSGAPSDPAAARCDQNAR